MSKTNLASVGFNISIRFLIGTIALTGIGLAGFSLKGHDAPSTIHIVDIRQISPNPTGRWNSEGQSVVTPNDVAADPVSKLGASHPGARRVLIRITPDLYVKTDRFRVWPDKPASVINMVPPHGDGKPGEGEKDGSLGVYLQASMTLSHAHIRVGRATELYRIYAKQVSFKTTNTTTQANGDISSSFTLEFPKALKDADYRVFVLTDKGRVYVHDDAFLYTEDEDAVPRSASVDFDKPTKIRAVGIENRPFVMTSFDIPLAPNAPLLAVNGVFPLRKTR